MIGIKKVEVTPIDLNIGKIIDSASTTDDKTKNTYSMRVIDEELGTKVKQSNFAIVTGTITLTDGTGNAQVNYPSDFTVSNCVVLSVGMGRATGFNPVEFNLLMSSSCLGAHLYNDYIRVNAISIINSGVTGTVNFQVILMKIS